MADEIVFHVKIKDDLKGLDDFEKRLQDLAKQFNKAFQSAKTASDTFKRATKEAADTTKEAETATKGWADAFQPLMAAMSSWGKRLIESSKYAQKLIASFESIKTKGVSIFNSLSSTISQYAQKLENAFIRQITPALGVLAKAFVAIREPYLKFTGMFNDFVSKVAPLFAPITQKIGELVKAVGEKVKAVVATIQNMASKFKALFDGMGKEMLAAINPFTAFADKVRSVGVGLASVLNPVNLLTSAFKGLASLVTSAMSGIMKAVTSAAQAIGKAVGKMGELVWENLSSSIKAFSALEDKMIVVRRVMGLNDDQTKSYTKSMRDLALELKIIPIETLADLAGVAATMGIEGEANIQQFTAAISKLKHVSDVDAIKAAENIGAIGTVMGAVSTDMGAFVERFSTLTSAVSDKLNTTAKSVIEVSKNIAGTLSTFGFSEEQVVAVSATVSAVEKRFSTGGSAIVQILSSMGKNMDAWASGMGLNAAEVRRAFEQDVGGGMRLLLGELQNVLADGSFEEIQLLFDELGVSSVRAKDVMAKLALATESWDKAMQVANAEMEKTVSTLDEKFIDSMRTLTSQTDSLTNMWDVLKGLIGEPFANALTAILERINPIVENFIRWVMESEILDRTLTPLFEMAIDGFDKLLGIVTAYITKIALLTGIEAEGLTTWKAISAIWEQLEGKVQAYLLTLISASEEASKAGTIYEGLWILVKEKLGGAWEYVKAKATEAWKYLNDQAEAFGQWWNQNGDDVKQTILGIMDTLKKLAPTFSGAQASAAKFKGAIDVLAAPFRLLDEVSAFWADKLVKAFYAATDVINGMVSAVSKLVDWLGNKLQGAINRVTGAMKKLGLVSHEKSVLPDMMEWAQKVAGAGGMGGLKGSVDTVTQAMSTLGDVAYGHSVLPDMAAWGDKVGDSVDSIKEKLSRLDELMKKHSDEPKQWQVWNMDAADLSEYVDSMEYHTLSAEEKMERLAKALEVAKGRVDRASVFEGKPIMGIDTYLAEWRKWEDKLRQQMEQMRKSLKEEQQKLTKQLSDPTVITSGFAGPGESAGTIGAGSSLAKSTTTAGAGTSGAKSGATLGGGAQGRTPFGGRDYTPQAPAQQAESSKGLNVSINIPKDSMVDEGAMDRMMLRWLPKMEEVAARRIHS